MDTNLDLQIDVRENTLPNESDFQRWVNLANDSHENAEVCIRIVSALEMQTLNRDYRQKDHPTNVLAFAYAHNENFAHTNNDPLLLGDIALCHDVIKEEARLQNKSLEDHYAHLTLHGVLHLLGYEHQTDTDAENMENREITLLKSLAINNPYQAGTL
jgi:probable rRNA maturation factor